MASITRECSSCSFFETTADSADEGECRRYAPRPASDRRETMWVTVSARDWCGDYLAA